MTEDVIVIADWDADGVVSAAMILYAQQYQGKYPLKGKRSVALRPATPRTLAQALRWEPSYECPEVIMFLDIPYVKHNYKIILDVKRRCGRTRIVYIDHHLSTIHNAHSLEKLVDEVIVGYSSTALLVYNLLRAIGVRLTPRLENFARAINYMERSIKVPPELESMVKLASSISKAMKVEKNEELWERLVKWMASPLPFTTPPPLDRAIDKAQKLAERADELLKHLSLELAMSAEKYGHLRLVNAQCIDLRGASTTALTSRIYKILRKPVILFTERDERKFLVIKAGRGLAAKIASMLMRYGIVEDVGGHASIAVLRIKGDVDFDVIRNVVKDLALKFRL